MRQIEIARSAFGQRGDLQQNQRDPDEQAGAIAVLLQKALQDDFGWNVGAIRGDLRGSDQQRQHGDWPSPPKAQKPIAANGRQESRKE